MIRRLTYMFAAGLVATATALTTAGAAGASTASAPRTGCQFVFSDYLRVTSMGINYYLGTPNTTSAGAVVRLKPAANGTTYWTFCQDTSASNEYALYNRNLVLSATRQTDANVTMEHAGNLGAGFALQRWYASFTATTVTLTNVRTGQFLRVRNNGPIMGQTVTTGFSPTAWTTP